jgi:hypothetical protein
MDRNSASGAVRGVRLSRMIALLVVTGAIWGASIAAGRCDAVADFCRGRSISLVIGFGAGGGYDAYARLLARHIGRHIPGNPSLVAQNMQGAGGLKATQFLYDVAPRDGTVIGTVARGQPLAPLLLENTSFDVAMRKEIVDRHPWTAVNLFNAFEKAKNRSVARALYGGMTYFPILWGFEHALRTQTLFDGDYWPYGVESNRRTLEAFLRYAHEQGVCHRLLRVEELFPPQLLRSYRV